jgi:Flp pilus assembly protein TadD
MSLFPQPIRLKLLQLLLSVVPLVWVSVGEAHALDCEQDFSDAQQMVYAFPDDPESFEVLGESQACRMQCVESWKSLSKAVNLGASKSVMKMAESCMTQLVSSSSCEVANAQARRLVELDPKSALAHTILADAMRCQSGCAERLVVLSKAVQLGADSSLIDSPDLSCIDTMIDAGRCSEAIDEVEHALTVLPKSADIYLTMGRARACSGECVEAWDAVVKAGRLGADISENRSAQRCMVGLIKSGECEGSQAQAKTIVTRYSKDPHAQALYAEAMTCSGSCVESYIAWNKAVTLGAPDKLGSKGEACLRRGLDAGRCDDITTQTRTLLKTYPKSSSLYTVLGDSQSCQQDCVSASASYGKAVRYGAPQETSQSGAMCFTRLVERGDCDEALDQASKLAKANSRSTEAAWAKAEARTCKGDYRGALADYQRYEKLGGDTSLAAEGISQSRSKLSSLTIRVKNSVAGRSIPKPKIEGIDPSLIQYRGDGVYQALDINPTKVRITIDAGEKYWPIERNIRLQAGSQEEIELTVLRAVYSNLTIGSYSSELSVSVMDPRSGTLHTMEPNSELKIAAGPSQLNARMKTGSSEVAVELPIVLEEGVYSLPMPWGWRVVNPATGQVMDSGLTTDESASVKFRTELPLTLRPVPIAEHQSLITGTPGQILDYQLNMEAHPSSAAFDAWKGYQGSGRRHKTMHWSLLGAAAVLEGVAIAQFRSAVDQASVARGITDPRAYSSYTEAISNSRRAQGMSVGLALTGGVALGTSMMVTRPKVRGRAGIEKDLKQDLMAAIDEPIAIQKIDSRSFHDKAARFDPSTARSQPDAADSSFIDVQEEGHDEPNDFYDDPDDLDSGMSRRVTDSSSRDGEKNVTLTMGVAIAPLVTSNSPNQDLIWSFEGSTRMPRYMLRASRSWKPRIDIMGSIYATPKFAVINDYSETYQESIFMLGLGYSWRELGPIEIRPQLGLGVLNRKVAPEGTYNLHEISPAVDLGTQLVLPFGDKPISAYSEFSLLLNLPDFAADMDPVVTTSGVQAIFGLNASF